MIRSIQANRTVTLFLLLSMWLLASSTGHTLVQIPALEQAEEVVAPEKQIPVIEAPEQSETPAPLPIGVPGDSADEIREEIQSLTQALQQRREALAQTQKRQAFAEARWQRLKSEFDSLQLRLETAGLDLTENYANLLRRRLERLERKHLADNLESAIKEQLEAARIEQLQLEEFDAVLEGESPTGLVDRRSALLTDLSQVVSQHIEILSTYFDTIHQLERQIKDYQILVRERLFWLPSTEPVSWQTFVDFSRAIVWLADGEHWRRIFSSVPASVKARWPMVLVLTTVLMVLLLARRRVRARLLATGDAIDNVAHDRIGYTFQALGHSVVLALSGVVALVLLGQLLVKSGDFGVALSNGLINSALLLFLLEVVQQVARPGGLAQQHFKWQPQTLRTVRSDTSRLLWILLPAAVLVPLTEVPVGEAYANSLGRMVFTVASLALAVFVHRLFTVFRSDHDDQRTPRALVLFHGAAVAAPIVFASVSLLGYHYTAVQLEGTLFISVCWLVFLTILRYLCLRALSVRERRLKLERFREQRAAEQQREALLEAAGSSGEGRRTAKLEMPEINLHDISTQSKALLGMVIVALAVGGIWFLWAPVFPALNVLDKVTLWSIIEGEQELPVTLADLCLTLILIGATVYAARNLPGVLEVTLLSRMDLAPGSSYAITRVVNYLIIIIGSIWSLNMIGAQWSKLQWLVAALGVGLGFGLQEIVANFVSGIILLFERPIRVGDTVTIDGITGTVSRIRTRATTLVDWDHKEQVIPNKTFINQDLTNWTLSDSINRVIVRVGVAHGSDIDQVQALLLELVKQNARVVDDPEPAVFCVGLGESRIEFELRVFVNHMVDFMPLYHELHAAIPRVLADAGISIPFPQRDIHVRTAVPVTQTGSGCDR